MTRHTFFAVAWLKPERTLRITLHLGPPEPRARKSLSMPKQVEGADFGRYFRGCIDAGRCA